MQAGTASAGVSTTAIDPPGEAATADIEQVRAILTSGVCEPVTSVCVYTTRLRRLQGDATTEQPEAPLSCATNTHGWRMGLEPREPSKKGKKTGNKRRGSDVQTPVRGCLY